MTIAPTVPNIKNTFSRNINFLMEEKGVTRRKVCNDLNIKYTTFCDWVNGRTFPHEDQLEKLGRYFGIAAGEFFIEFDQRDSISEQNRLKRYYTDTRRLNMNVLNHMTDDQIRNLLSSGFTFEHKTLEEYVSESRGSFIASDEFDWGEPVGQEIW